MNIAIFSDTYKPMVSGLVVSLENHATNLTKRGHKVKIFTITDKEKIKPPKNIGLYLSKAMDLPTYKGLKIARPNVVSIVKELKTFKPDIIHSMTPFGMGSQAVVCSKILNVPLVFTEHTLYVDFIEHVSIKKAPSIKDKIKLIIGTVWSGQTTFITMFSATLVSYYRSLRQLKLSLIVNKSSSQTQLFLRNSLKNIFKLFNKIGFSKKEKDLGKKGNFEILSMRTAIKKATKKQIQNFFWSYLLDFYNQSNLVSTPSLAMKDLLIKKGVKKPVRAISNGVNQDLFDIKKVEKNPAKIKIIHVGRIAYEKNIDVCIKAATLVIKNNPNVTMDIYGNGPEFDQIQDLIKTLGMTDKIKMKGMANQKELPLYYSRADIFITASTIETEGIVMLEAMSCGLPVVAVKAMACKNAVDHGKTGFLGEPDNSQEMAKYITKLIKEPNLRKEMAKNAYVSSKKYDLHKIIDEWEKIYTDLKKNNLKK